MLSKYEASWNSFADRRCAGRRVMSRGSRSETSLGGMWFDFDIKKLLFWVGMVEEDAKRRLYEDREPETCSGEACGEL